MSTIIFITITKINDYMGTESLKTGQTFFLRKETDNRFDDETIEVISENGCRYGYVANSVGSVIRGTHSAGYIYDKITDDCRCLIRFIGEEKAIAELIG